MRKPLCIVLVLVMLLSLSVQVAAASPSFAFDLTVDGKNLKEVEKGDIITVTVRLSRTDAAEPYMMYAMQNELRYDATFLELVEDSVMVTPGIVTRDIAMVDRHREFYMNYLSMEGGTQWNSNMLIGSVQFRVIGDSGVCRITNQDSLVSKEDGSGGYACEVQDLTIMLSENCIITFETNGGSEIPDMTVAYGKKLSRPDDPVLEGYHLEGWYKDIHLTEEWDFEEDTVEENMTLYAKWAEGEPSEKPGGAPGFRIWWLALILIPVVIFIILKRKK